MNKCYDLFFFVQMITFLKLNNTRGVSYRNFRNSLSFKKSLVKI